MIHPESSCFSKKDSLVISTRKTVMIVPKVLCGGADSGSAGGAQRCEPGEVKFHPSGEAQQDIPSYPLSRRYSFRRKGKDVWWLGMRDFKWQEVAAYSQWNGRLWKSFSNESLRVWGARKCGIWSENILSRCTTSSQSWRWESEQSALPLILNNSVLHDLYWFVYSRTILSAIGTLPLTLQLTMS